MFVKTKNFTDTELGRFRELQASSFSILESTAANLQAGQTEKQVANDLFHRYRDAGFTSFFHLPVVLFGERTALPGNFTLGKFFPKSRALCENDSVILDASPIKEGYLVDTSYSFCFGENADHQTMMLNIAQFRDQVCEAVNSGQSFKTIAEQVEADIRAMGYEAVHCKHPGEVLGHRAAKLPNSPFKWRINGFDGLALSWFGVKDKMASLNLGRHAPLWNTSKNSDHPPHDGLWLVEPHAGMGSIGTKWEEILLIENGKAVWLEDQPPHVKQVELIKQRKSYRPRI